MFGKDKTLEQWGYINNNRKSGILALEGEVVSHDDFDTGEDDDDDGYFVDCEDWDKEL